MRFEVEVILAYDSLQLAFNSRLLRSGNTVSGLRGGYQLRKLFNFQSTFFISADFAPNVS